MRKTMLYIIAGIVVIIIITVVVYMRHVARNTPSIIGNEQEREMQEKVGAKNDPEKSQ